MALFSKSVNTLRDILEKEFVLPKHYSKVISRYAGDINRENAVVMAKKCKGLLEGRQILAELLSTIIERNKLVDSLKKMVRLAMA